jgi:hypothetical protein
MAHAAAAAAFAAWGAAEARDDTRKWSVRGQLNVCNQLAVDLLLDSFFRGVQNESESLMLD